MNLEIAVGLAIVFFVALLWHTYTRPENVLGRLIASLDIPADILHSYEPTFQDRLELVRHELENRYEDAWSQVAGAMYASYTDEAFEQASEDLRSLSHEHPGAEATAKLLRLLEPVRMESDDTGALEELEDRLIDLEEDFRLLRKLERVLAERAAAA